MGNKETSNEVDKINCKVEKLEDEKLFAMEEIEHARDALEIIMDEYEWRDEPDIVTTCNAMRSRQELPISAKNTIDFIAGYKKIMLLIRVANNYIYEAMKFLKESEAAER